MYWWCPIISHSARMVWGYDAGMITERAESSHDPLWAETGDHYLLKLFRDWVFHRHTDAGGPSVDWGFVVEALNKVRRR
jgi:PAB-dependent poly(A)-specific ribonuclease subunit 3